MEKDIKTCNCDENCDCGCEENKECKCEEKCSCNEECNCNDDCEGNGNVNCECPNEKKKDKHKKKDKKEEKIKELENRIQELEEKALRDKAEMINYRKRKDEDVARMLKFCNEDLVTEMLPVIDNFESAIKMDDNNLDDEVSKFLAGFKMIYGNLLTIFEKFDIKPIDGNNKPFDPTYHQAVMTEHVDDMEAGMVIDVLRKGYILKDKVIRPAMVKVSE